MPGRGPAPKNPEDRARTPAPGRGEWTDLPPLTESILPELEGENWLPRTRRLWDAWRQDWATQVFGPSEIALALETIDLFERAQETGDNRIQIEFRHWTDRLGLNPKGKRDLRLRLVAPQRVESQPASELGDLRLVDSAVSA